ncbi:hypothetical protein GZH53_14555 [Flavihumibacter sp. R14]|nr:hypothetical protein [Flavihumibacter soli]
MVDQKLKIISRVITFLCGIGLIIVLFVPLWQIELEAPQYPEGLVLLMHPHKLAGNVDIINGLNHYIGMKTLHTEDFLEFTLLPYIISFFAAFCFAVVLLNRRKVLVILFISFTVFGILAMADFYRWNYNYGHELDPNAAIRVPGMSYQPPLIGYKQLLNFGAYSTPHIGGWIFIGVGLLLLTAVVIQYRTMKKNHNSRIRKVVAGASVLLIFSVMSCSTGPEPIKLGVDACSFCKMSIADNKFGAEIVTKKGKIYKFDDTHCVAEFVKSNTIDNSDIKETYLVAFNDPHDFIKASESYLYRSDELRSPMGGNIAAFPDSKSLEQAAQNLKGEKVEWTVVMDK